MTNINWQVIVFVRTICSEDKTSCITAAIEMSKCYIGYYSLTAQLLNSFWSEGSIQERFELK